MIKTGIQPGSFTTGTVREYNPSTNIITVAVDNDPSIPPLQLPAPNAWTGPSGGIATGYPEKGTKVKILSGHGNQWHCLGYETNSNSQSSILNNPLISYNSQDIEANRFLIRAKNGNRLFVDPSGVNLGNSNFNLNISNDVVKTDFKQEIYLNEASRHISGAVRRFVKNENLDKPGWFTLGSVLYENNLKTIGLDPDLETNYSNTPDVARNPALAETRNIQYEFAHSYDFKTYEQEHSGFIKGEDEFTSTINVKSKNRAVSLSLSLENPNHLIETISGTVVDSFGNILDINRAILPIGRLDELSLKRGEDKSKTFTSILRELRKSIAYHFEINARKDINGELNVPDISDPSAGSDEGQLASDWHKRDRSRFFIDIDKEGQFKINIPASSETGNIPLLARYENFSVVKSKEDKKENKITPDTFVKSAEKVDIYLDSFSIKSEIKLSSTSEELDGYQAPTDRFTKKPINYGTAYHDITKTCNEFLKTAKYIEGNVELINFDKNNRLNNEEVWEPLEYIVSDTIVVSGDDANGGGRSGMINLDGFVALNIGANTIDRQSLWIDTAGGIIQNTGRDKNNISYAASFDGDVFWQIGGPGIGNQYDPRFTDQNDSYRNGTLDIRVLINGQIAIFRIGPDGIYIVSPGTINLVSEQDIIIKSKTNIKMEAEQIVMYAETAKRTVSRVPLQKLIM